MNAIDTPPEEVHTAAIARELSLPARQVRAAAALLAGGATVPFIARYRKEATGGLDEVAVTAIRDRLDVLRELDARRAAILKSLAEQGVLTDALKTRVMAAGTMSALEDVYLPYRPKRRTRGMIAREKGLEPLAKLLFEQGAIDPAAEAAAFVGAEKGVESADDALAGARDIIAEWINEDAETRARMRDLFAREAVLASKVVEGTEAKGAKYKDYFEWKEPLCKAPSHRVLAIRRGAEEGFLTFHILPGEGAALAELERRHVRGSGPASLEVKAAARDAYKRLLGPSMETEMRLETKKRADEEAIRVFASNLRELLLASPLGRTRVLAVDPGLRTGCKIVCLDPQGKLLHHDAIFPLEPFRKTEEAAEKVKALCRRFSIEAIAIGNGTGGREALAFAQGLDLGRAVAIVMVSESGASIYSASETARAEFPDKDVTVRGAVSIGRRLMDPLAELVKIDPKSIGVGQYQHDVDQKALKKSLDDVVVSCVNAVGVEVNTASPHLLAYVSGLSARLAGNIVAYRDEHGPFGTRDELREVSGMGPKTFEQAAGFLRIRDGANALDASAVHPESYGVVERMAGDLGCTVADLMRDGGLRGAIDPRRYVDAKVGLPTLADIMAELEKPGRDPRGRFEAFAFSDAVRAFEDVQVGMRLPGVVTNVTAFGAFVDIGVHDDGLVHVSRLADRFVKNPAEVVKVHQKVLVTVVSVDAERKRIGLSMRTNPADAPVKPAGAEAKASAKGGANAGARTRARPADAEAKASAKGGNVFADFFDNLDRRPKM
ncbi:MAG TPA: RNA-binding transcriptional accessory protein [Planctomycetes bacterium]|nr:RNA-binding transcriptional accessory protein [Planctomycetota bacterium]